MYIRCPKCGDEQWLETRQRCESCGAVLRRCIDCARYRKADETCGVTGFEIALYEAQSPTALSLSCMCKVFEPSVVSEGVAEPGKEAAAESSPQVQANVAATAAVMGRTATPVAEPVGEAMGKVPVRRDKQICVFLQNRAGRLAELTTALAAAQINIVAMSISDTTDYGLARLVVNQPMRAHEIMRDKGMPFSEVEVLVVEIVDRPGALAEISRKLARAGQNIEYAYFTSANPGSPLVVVLRVTDLDRAQAALLE